MLTKRTEAGALERGLNRFLSDDRHLILGFQKGDGGVRHRIFKKSLDRLALLTPSST